MPTTAGWKELTIGRLSFTSPRTIDINSDNQGNRNNMDRKITLSGSFYADTVATAKDYRDELISLANSTLTVPFTYTGDTTFKGFCTVEDSSVRARKLATGYFDYSVSITAKGRPSEMMFESNMSGALLTNSHSLTTSSTTYAPWHAVPVNTYNYYHTEAPVNATRATEDGNLEMFYDANLRNSGAQWICEPADFYKGGAKITINSVVKTGYLTQNYPTGAEISNGIVKITSGSTTDESRFTVQFYDNGSWTSSREIAFTYGSSGTEWKLWKTVQILRNEPQECVLRFTTYSDSGGDGRLVVDVGVKRGAHHISLVANQGPTSDRAAASRINLDGVTDVGALSSSTGYLKESSADSSGQKFIFGSPQNFTADTTNKLIHISAKQFKTFIGYEYNASSPATIDASDAVRDQYLEGLYENVRLVRA
tara:strand:+ start:778 stop:2049 length:1272 start_codon:yes stop_codon:yes gene_type:complete